MRYFFSFLFVFAVGKAQAAQLQVVNESGQPIAGASVLVGVSQEKGLQLKTDLNGTVILPDDLKSTQPITISAASYLTTTFQDISLENIILQIEREDSRNIIEVRGRTTNFGDLKKDGKVDFALVYPGLRERQLAQFDIESVINADSDILEILTEKLIIPSNLTLPEQRESYVLPITLSKPVYRISFKQPSNYRMMALHGQFPLKQIISDVRGGKSFYEVINHFRFLSGGQRDITVNNAISDQDIPVNQFNLDKKIIVQGPELGPDMVMFSFPLANQADMFFATDVKRITPGQSVSLVLPTATDGSELVSVIMPKSEAEKIGGIRQDLMQSGDQFLYPLKVIFAGISQFFKFFGGDLRENSGSGGLSLARHDDVYSNPVFLDIIPRPKVYTDILQMIMPRELLNVDPVTTFAILYEIIRVDKGDFILERSFKLWEVIQMGWTDEISLPSVIDLDPKKHYRWEVLFMGRSSNGKKGSGAYFLDGITHVTRNSLDF